MGFNVASYEATVRPPEMEGRCTTIGALVTHPSLPVHSSGRDEILGTAYSDHDLVVFLEGAGIGRPRGHFGRPAVGAVARRPRPRDDVRQTAGPASSGTRRGAL
ncbi:putative uncharacterized protein [Streptomyces azureus]|uniref:Uncharacterized protein n=1 Tax=Streptomyces azureus TaxID=146537 RepID=A0A0K8PI40_STRAJ|nr:putative uncharacterized protein [Streptomyces azureus]